MSIEPSHEPVLPRETLTALGGALEVGGGYVVDCTLGLGGHAERILEAFPKARLLGIDQDLEALELSRQRLARFGSRVRLQAGNFRDLRALTAFLDEPVRGVLADLGVSSMQLDRGERGFSFRFDGPLDMRMGSTGPTAADVLSTYSEADLERIFKHYGQERQGRRIARALVERRETAPLQTTRQLREAILAAKGLRSDGATPGGWRHREGRVDPATRVFQALRIEVNGELDALESFLDQAIESLEEDGRLVVISYHSLEDRIVKHTLRDRSKGEVDQITGRSLPERRLIEVLTKKPLRPTPEEVASNPRARSARLRAARKLRQQERSSRP
ncbi:MAG: 16S rRNA (cytosine(1402)-N(4))-methyltransferase RsmH [Acidobacteriota bacterium]